MHANVLLLPNEDTSWRSPARYIALGHYHLEQAVKYLNSQMVIAALRELSSAHASIFAASVMISWEAEFSTEAEMRQNSAARRTESVDEEALQNLVHRYRLVRETFEEHLRRRNIG